MTKVMTFGTFDGLHKGHLELLEQARVLGDELIAVIALDETVSELKGKKPVHSLKDRVLALEELRVVDRVLPGDKTMDTYSVIIVEEPDIIAIGYDQSHLLESIKKWLTTTKKDNIKIEVLEPFKPEKYKSSLLNK